MARAEHGHTIAAWTTVLIALAGIFIGALGVVLLNWPLFWIGGVGVIVLGLVVGKVLQMMGLGKAAAEAPVGAPDEREPAGAAADDEQAAEQDEASVGAGDDSR